MSKTVLMQVKGFTPLIDSVTKQCGVIVSAVFGQIWRYCQMDDDICKASHQRIADDLGIDRSTVMRHTETLVQAGYLEDLDVDVTNRPHRYRDTGKAGLEASLDSKNGGAKNHTSTPNGGAENHSKTGEGVVKSTTGVAENDSRGGTEPLRGVVNCNMKIDSLRESLRNKGLESDVTLSINPERGAGEEKEKENPPIAAAEAWPAVAYQLQREMQHGLYATWVEPLKPMTAIQATGKIVFRLQAVNRFAGEWVQSRLGTRIQRLAEAVYKQPVDLEIIAPT